MPVSAFLVVLASFGALPEGVTAYSRVEPAVIPFHQLATYTLVLEMPPGTAFQPHSMLGRFDGLVSPGGGETREEILKNGRIRVTIPYQIEAIFPGNYALEPAEVTINGETYTVPSPVLTVRDLTEEELKIAEEFDAALPKFDTAVGAPFYRQWWFWALLFAAAALGALAGYALRRRAAGGLDAAKTPWEIALARLDALRARDLPEKREFDRFYVDLSAILRYYIEGRFSLHAPERTTEEFLKEMAEAKLFNERQEAFLASFLKHCDYVKFARLEPAASEMTDRLEQVVEFITETIPAPTSDAPAKAA